MFILPQKQITFKQNRFLRSKSYLQIVFLGNHLSEKVVEANHILEKRAEKIVFGKWLEANHILKIKILQITFRANRDGKSPEQIACHVCVFVMRVYVIQQENGTTGKADSQTDGRTKKLSFLPYIERKKQNKKFFRPQTLIFQWFTVFF